MKPKLSIIIPGIRVANWENVYNSIQSSITYPFEVIFISPYTLPAALRKDNIKHVRDFGSPIRCSNIGLELCEGDLLIWQADDGVFQPEMLDKAIAAYREMGDGEKNVLILRYYEKTRYKQPNSYYKLWNAYPQVANVAGKDWWIFNFALMKTSYVRRLGGWDSRFETSAFGHADFAIRAQQDKCITKMFDDEIVFNDHGQDDHGPVEAGHDQNDYPLYVQLHNDPININRINVDIDSWKQAPAVWSRRFGHVQDRLAQLAEQKIREIVRQKVEPPKVEPVVPVEPPKQVEHEMRQFIKDIIALNVNGTILESGLDNTHSLWLMLFNKVIAVERDHSKIVKMPYEDERSAIIHADPSHWQAFPRIAEQARQIDALFINGEPTQVEQEWKNLQKLVRANGIIVFSNAVRSPIAEFIANLENGTIDGVKKAIKIIVDARNLGLAYYVVKRPPQPQRNRPEISIAMPSIRADRLVNYYNSITKSTKRSFELVICGPYNLPVALQNKPNVVYIKDFGSPVRCSNIALEKCTGELVTWGADNCPFFEGALDEVIDLFHLLPDTKKKAVVYRYCEAPGANAPPHPLEYFYIKSHGSIDSPYIPSDYLIYNSPLLYTDYMKEMGGLDSTKFQTCPMAHTDLAIRCQTDECITVLAIPPVINCDQYLGRTGDHAPINDIQGQFDEPMYRKMFIERDYRNRHQLQIPLNNWQKSPSHWEPRFGKKPTTESTIKISDKISML